MSSPDKKVAAPEDARMLFQCPELADFLETSFADADLNLDGSAFTFTPVT